MGFKHSLPIPGKEMGVGDMVRAGKLVHLEFKGKMIMDFCAERGLCVGNTFYVNTIGWLEAKREWR